MTTVAFIVDAIPSHIYSSMGLARRLQRLGFDVEYWGIARNGSDALIASQGFTFHRLPGLWSRYQEDIRLPTDLSIFNVWFRCGDLWRRAVARRARRYELSHALDQVETSLEVRLNDSQPAFVVADPFLLAYYPFLRRKGIVTVVLSTKPLPIRDRAVPPYDSPLVPNKSPWTTLKIAASWKLRQLKDVRFRLVRLAARTANLHTHDDILREAARRTHFELRREIVRRWMQPDLHFESIHEWALWTPDMDLPRVGPLPENVRYVGPSVDLDRRQHGQLHVGKERLIYVAVGTVRFRWKDNVPFLRKVIEALSGLPDVFVMISTGDERATKALNCAAANVRVHDFLPQLQILETARLVITHAGAGTYRECIEKCVPMLAYPRNHDQVGNAARIVYHGLGLRGHRKWDSVAAIREKALAILGDDSYQRNLRKLRDSIYATESQLLCSAVDSIVPGFFVPRFVRSKVGAAG